MSKYGSAHPEEYSDRVDELRQHRCEMSFYKYGSAKINFGQHLVDALKSHDLCVQKYKETGNTEYLLDAMNYLMFEFEYPSKPNAYFKATGSDESAGIVGVSITESSKDSRDQMIERFLSEGA